MGPAVTTACYRVRVGLDKRIDGSKTKEEGRGATSNYLAKKHHGDKENDVAGRRPVVNTLGKGSTTYISICMLFSPPCWKLSVIYLSWIIFRIIDFAMVISLRGDLFCAKNKSRLTRPSDWWDLNFIWRPTRPEMANNHGVPFPSQISGCRRMWRYWWHMIPNRRREGVGMVEASHSR